MLNEPSSSSARNLRTYHSCSAYIAASRRSDRSLEARVESARRASEIHKRRTGRSLRVTEQDVVNEEMYEEDDDLPMQYRRLTAHLQTGSADFNRRLSAYLTNHVAMRSALDQAITNSYAQQYPNAPQFAHNQTMYPSPFVAQPMPQQQPSHYGQPYPSPGTPAYRPSHNVRGMSTPNGTPQYSPSLKAPSPMQQAIQMDHRVTSASSNKSTSHSPHGTPPTPQSMPAKSSPAPTSATYNGKQEPQASQLQMRAPPQPPQHQSQQSQYPMVGYPNISPFSTSLPMESQMMLGSALDPNDPLTSMLMAGNENVPQAYNYGSRPTMQKPRSTTWPYDGMSATLAPSALDMSPRHHSYAHPPLTATPSPATSPAFLSTYDGLMPDFSKGQIFPGTNSSHGSDTATPGNLDSGWDAFINDSGDTSWADNTT